MAVRFSAKQITLCLVAALFIASGTTAIAQIVGNPAGPRTGTVYELEVDLADRAALQDLDRAGYNIGHVGPSLTVEIYATPEERDQLLADGYTVRTVGQQPDPLPESTGEKALGVYHTYAQLTAELQAYAATFPAICDLISIGQSVQGRELWALHISDNPLVEEDEPEFKFTGTIHGDEPVGTEMQLYLIDSLLNDYGVVPRITNLVDETSIWFLPLHNPDGRTLGTRNNANGFDLNRSFPTYQSNFTGTLFDGEPLGLAGRQPEVQVMMLWTAMNSFVLSGNTHGGALVANYPYDYTPGVSSGQPAIAPDDALLQNLALRYSTTNAPMFASFPFPNGITNGSEWYSITGGMQDWNYRYTGCIDMTLELSNIKTPSQATIPGFWVDNEESMLAYMEGVHIGVRGLVRNAQTGMPLWASVSVAGNSQRVFTDPDIGDYHRLLLPGTYDLTISAPEHHDQTIIGVVVGPGTATRIDVFLQPIVPLPLPALATPLVALLAGLLTVAFMLVRRRGSLR